MLDNEVPNRLQKVWQPIYDEFLGVKITSFALWGLRSRLSSRLQEELDFQFSDTDIVVSVAGSNINVDFKGKLREELIALGLING